jgi:CRP-like cAMP-binding protein
MEPQASLERTLRASNLFAGVAPEIIAEVARCGARRRFLRGEHIFRSGEPATFVGVVARGLVKLVRPVPDGVPCIVALWGPRQTIGNLAVIARAGYPGNAIVISDEADIVTLDGGALLASAERRPALAWARARSLAEHGHALHEKIGIMSAGPVERRLKALLAHLLERFGDEYDDGTQRIPVALSRGELASLVGATVETTIRAMSRWQKQRLLETSGEGFRVLDPTWLASAETLATPEAARPAA